LTLPTSGIATSTINISGATNPTLGQNGQDLKAVHINMLHDAIDELDITLFAPDGSSVLLSQETGFSLGQNITFDICFVACNETASPDPGFPANFDSQAGYQQNMTYTGIYYPSVGGGCFEDLTGSVNGDWILEFEDNVGLDGGTLFDWSLEFYDNGGLGCPNVCNISSCLADGGDLMGSSNEYCEGDPNLNLNLSPTYSGSQPDPALYGYTYVISDNTTDVILDYSMNPDLTTYTEGDYRICGLSYLQADFNLIPQPDGNYTVSDLENDINNNVFCADLSEGCETVTITAPLSTPIIAGPDVVCAGETVTYDISNFAPNINYTVTIQQGSIGAFNYSGGSTATVEWLAGPGQICFEATNICGTESTCVNVTVEPNAPPFQINGNQDVCPGVTETYIITPPPGPSQNYTYTVTGGNIVNQSSDEVEIDWFVNGGNNSLCVDLQGSNCPSQTECITINVEDYQLPSNLNTPNELCIGQSGSSSISSNPAITSYNWSGSGITITNGQGTNAVDYTADQTGLVSICLEIETDCGIQGPVCEDIDVSLPPQPSITPFGPTCELSFNLDAGINSGNTVNWSQISGPPGLVFNPNDQPFTNVNVPEAGLYTIVISETSNLCTGYDTIEIEVFPSPVIQNTTFDCTLDEYAVTFDITNGTPPYEVNGTQVAGNSFTSGLIQSGNSFIYTVTDDNGCTDEVTDSYDCPCLSEAGSMSNTLLEVCAAENEIASATHNGDEFLDGNDVSGYVLHDSPDPALGNIINRNSTGDFSYQANMIFGQVYYISFIVGNDDGNGSVDLNDPCLSVSVGQAVIFYDDPEIAITSEMKSCELEFPLSADLSTGVQQVQWSQVDGPGFSTFTNPQIENTFVTVSEAGIYTYRIIAMNFACTDTLEFEFEVFGAPDITTIQESCLSLDEYILTFTVQGSGSPYSSNLPGNFNGNVFTSDTLMASDSYSITVTDNQGCNTTFEYGPIQCDCVSEAGNMSMDSILLCETEDSIHISFLGGQTLDGDDTEGFAIHKGASNLLDEVVFITNNTSFPIPDTLTAGQNYYISHIVGNELNGLPDLNDPCLDVSEGQLLYLFPIPGFSISPENESCEKSIALNISNGGNGNATILSNSNAANISINVSAQSIDLETDIPTILSIEYEEANARCSRSDTIRVEFLPIPTFENLVESCVGQSYYFSFEIENGRSPYTLNGDTLSSTIFQSDTIPSGSRQTFVLKDANNCRSDTLIIEKDCSCLGNAGRVNTSPITLCSGEALDLALLDLEDSLLVSGDTLVYILHDGNQDSIGQALFISEGSPIAYSQQFSENTSYYLTVASGDIENGAIDFTDPCFDQTQGVEVQWLSKQNVSLSQEDTSCFNDTLNISIHATGRFPFELQISSNEGRQKSLTLTDSITDFQIAVQYETEIWEVDSIIGICPGIADGAIEINGISPQNVTFRDPLQVCNNALFGSQLQLNELLLNSSLKGEWSSEDIAVQGNIVEFDGLAAGVYTFTFDTRGFEDPCAGAIYETSVEVIECECPNLSPPQELNICNTRTIFSLDSVIQSPLAGNWVLQNPNQLSSPPTIINKRLDLQDATTGTYNLVYTISDSLPSQCQSSYIIDLHIEKQLSSGIQTDIPVFCQDRTEKIQLFSLLTDADTAGLWLQSNDTLSKASFIVDQLDIGIREYTYRQVASMACVDSETTVRFEIAPQPQFTVNTQAPQCYNENNGNLSIAIDEDIYAPYSISVNGELQDSTFIDQLGRGSYIVRVQNNKGCVLEKDSVIIAPADAIEVELGDDLSVNAGESVDYTAEVNVPDSLIQTIQWFTSSGLVESGSLNISRDFVNDEILSINVEDLNGCTAQDSIRIAVKKGNIYIPNVFRPNSENPLNQQFGIAQSEQIENIVWLRVFDRWGNLLYNAENISPGSDDAYWNGQVNGQMAPSGVYVYSIKYINREGEEVYSSGDVSLLP
jgi:gliding motility-associated-like protein